MVVKGAITCGNAGLHLNLNFSPPTQILIFPKFILKKFIMIKFLQIEKKIDF